jgi:hypothetical protein
MIYDTLFALDGNLEVKPQMVDRWSTSDDKRTWTFTLRDERWLGKSAQWAKWSFCLTTARMAEDQEPSWAHGHGGTTQRFSRREWRWRR